MPSLGHLGPLGGSNPRLRCQRWVKDKGERDERIYQAVRVYGYTLKQVAEAVGLSYSTVSVIAKKVAETKGRQKNKHLTPAPSLRLFNPPSFTCLLQLR